MRRALAWSMLAACILAPLAAAGNESDPEVPGVPDFDEQELDFQGAWFEPDTDGVRFTIKIGGADEPPADHYYAVTFTFAGRRHVAVVAFDRDGDAHTDLRSPDFNAQGLRGAESFGERLRDASFRAGSPAYVSALIPYDALPGLAPGKVIIDLGAATGFYDRARRAWDDVDGRDTSNAYVVERAILPAFVQRNAGALAMVALLVASAAVLAVALILRRRSARDRASRTTMANGPPSPPPASPPGDDARRSGQRFRLDPRK